MTIMHGVRLSQSARHLVVLTALDNFTPMVLPCTSCLPPRGPRWLNHTRTTPMNLQQTFLGLRSPRHQHKAHKFRVTRGAQPKNAAAEAKTPLQSCPRLWHGMDTSQMNRSSQPKKAGRRRRGTPSEAMSESSTVDLKEFCTYLSMCRNNKANTVGIVEYLYRLIGLLDGISEATVMANVDSQNILRELVALPTLDPRLSTSNKIANALDVYFEYLMVKLDESVSNRENKLTARHLRLLK